MKRKCDDFLQAAEYRLEERNRDVGFWKKELEEETAAMKVSYCLMWTMSWMTVTILDRPSWRCWRTAGGTWTTPWPRLRDPSESTLNASRFWGLMTALFVFIN